MDREALASKIAATPRDVQCVENGSKHIGAEALYGLSKILGVAPSYFFEGMQQTMEAFAEIGAAAKKPSDRADEAPKPSTRRRARSLQDH
jgi:transcriptional regulator with XRE-family HTH domain